MAVGRNKFLLQLTFSDQVSGLDTSHCRLSWTKDLEAHYPFG
ncbi:hypothetical protein PsW64_02199 [Pseudovibrio sp. W64]|nr:hypothetical protein PsW64_02199 [Pseudovibrio sp. W64]